MPAKLVATSFAREAKLTRTGPSNLGCTAFNLGGGLDWLQSMITCFWGKKTAWMWLANTTGSWYIFDDLCLQKQKWIPWAPWLQLVLSAYRVFYKKNYINHSLNSWFMHSISVAWTVLVNSWWVYTTLGTGLHSVQNELVILWARSTVYPTKGPNKKLSYNKC